MQQLHLFFLLLPFCFSALWGVPQKSSFQKDGQEELKQRVSDLSYQLHVYDTEHSLVQEKLQEQSQEIQLLQKQLGQFKQNGVDGPFRTSLEQRLLIVEKNQEAFTEDLRKLKKNNSDTLAALSECKRQILELQKEMQESTATVKRAVHSLVQHYKKQGVEDLKQVSKTYRVKAGDSLEKIAKQNNLSVQTLKELNELKNDRIIVDQELILE